MEKIVSQVADKIKRITIQGARNVAIAAIKAIEEGAKKSKASSKKEFVKELSDAKDILFEEDGITWLSQSFFFTRFKFMLVF